MIQTIEFTPAYDKRNPDPNKNYGIHGVNLRMVLSGDLGAVQFVLFTNRQLPEVTLEMVNKHVPDDFPFREELIAYSGDFTSGKELEEIIRHEEVCSYLPEKDFFFKPMACDLGYHSPVPHYEGQDIIQECCPYLNGKPCYYDGSTLNAERIYNLLIATESYDTVWEELNEYYAHTFGVLQ